RLLGYTPSQLSIYKQALVHSSQSIEITQNNERLEFLGDAILDAVVGAYLFKKYPKREEGFLTELRSKIVSRKKLGELGKDINLQDFINYDKEKVALSNRMLGNALEAVVGAVYLDRGYKVAERFIIEKLLHAHIDLDTIFQTDVNYKSVLLEWAQKRGKSVSFEMAQTEYDQVEERLFIMEARLNGEVVSSAKARSKKVAGKEAARKAIRKLGIEVEKA
ncbi:UNVERIFIED_CONTAM: hypothetical protein GTU68_052981, partial [Idotea baltica]|nr:hypothetical protein [Idotea baltica]